MSVICSNLIDMMVIVTFYT
uniref:Uncharacterized protein n=1 Tax=Anguilla anguilla TaxID=7936 RepID=A0A0E9TKR4_ANGAN